MELYNFYSSRGKAQTGKKKAIADGWTEVGTKRRNDDRVDVLGKKPEESDLGIIADAILGDPKPANLVAKKARKKTPTMEPTKPRNPSPSRKQTPLSSHKRLKKDGTPKLTTGVSGPRPIGVYSKLGIEQTWCAIFSKEASKKKAYWTDSQITTEMRRNFPERNSGVFARVGTTRAKYNRGDFNCQKGEPKEKAPTKI